MKPNQLSSRDCEVAIGALTVALIVKRQQASQFPRAEAQDADERADNEARGIQAGEDAAALLRVIEVLNAGVEGREPERKL